MLGQEVDIVKAHYTITEYIVRTMFCHPVLVHLTKLIINDLKFRKHSSVPNLLTIFSKLNIVCFILYLSQAFQIIIQIL